MSHKFTMHCFTWMKLHMLWLHININTLISLKWLSATAPPCGSRKNCLWSLLTYIFRKTYETWSVCVQKPNICVWNSATIWSSRKYSRNNHWLVKMDWNFSKYWISWLWWRTCLMHMPGVAPPTVWKLALPSNGCVNWVMYSQCTVKSLCNLPCTYQIFTEICLSYCGCIWEGLAWHVPAPQVLRPVIAACGYIYYYYYYYYYYSSILVRAVWPFLRWLPWMKSCEIWHTRQKFLPLLRDKGPAPNRAHGN